MTSKIIQCLILLAIAFGASLAIYIVQPFHKETKTSSTEAGATVTLNLPQNKPVRIGIIGSVPKKADEEGEDTLSVWENLLSGLGKLEVDAVFLNGNIVSNESKEVPVKEEGKQTIGERVGAAAQKFRNAIQKEAPLLPVTDDVGSTIPEIAESFKNAFHLEKADLKDGGLAYTVSAGPAFFAVIPAGSSFSQQVLTWLRGVLASAALQHRYLFVIGFDPAFPSTTTLVPAPMGQREAFWKVLTDYHVVAYFSAKEPLFDRSDRQGVWQVISGGETTKGGSNSPFSHALLLTIPEAGGKEEQKGPSLQIIDEQGTVIDTFELKSRAQPLFQMRIS
jgi:hypothetical protein